MNQETLLELADCCCCDKNLQDIGSKHINFLRTGRVAAWASLTLHGEALAIVCDHCIEQKTPMRMTYAVEYCERDGLLYRRLEFLESIEQRSSIS